MKQVFLYMGRSVQEFEIKQVGNHKYYFIIFKPVKQLDRRLSEFLVKVTTHHRSVYVNSLFHSLKQFIKDSTKTTSSY